MPNHVTFQLQMHSQNGEVQQFLDRCLPLVDEEITNYLNVDGKLETVKQKTGNRIRDFQFETLIPEPTYIGYDDGAAKITPEGLSTWYYWRLSNWGTKWGAYDLKILGESENFCHLRFETAWSPPTPIFEKIAEEFPALKGYVVGFEEGWRFQYGGKFDNGFQGESQDATAAGYLAAYGNWPEPYFEEEEEITDAPCP